MRCFHSLSADVQLTVAVAWIAHALHTDSAGLMLREGTAVNRVLLRRIDEAFSDLYLPILIDLLPSAWFGEGDERVWGPSILLVLHTIIKRIPPPEELLRWYGKALMDLRRSQWIPGRDSSAVFYRDLNDDRVGVRMPTTLLFEYNERCPEVLEASGEYLSAQ